MAGRFSVEAVFKAVDKITAPVSRMSGRVGKFTRKLERGLRNVNRTVGKLAQGLKSAATFAIAGVTVAATAAAIALKKFADSADALAKLSRRLDFPIEELQEWRFVAEQSGLSAEQFDKSLEKFTKTVGEARAGTGTLVTILKKSNPELLKQITSAENTAEAFDLYLQALRGTENQMDRTALATAAFGRTGAKFLNITEQSADAVKALRMEQRENGVITKQQANAAEAWNDALNSLTRSLIGLRDSVLAPLLPIFTEYARKLREMIIVNRELITQKIQKFFKFVGANAGSFLKVAKNVGIAIGVITALIIALKIFIVVMTAVNLVMSLNPIVLIVLAIIALIAAVAAAIIWWDELKAAFMNLSTGAKIAIAAVVGPIGWLVAAAGLIMENWEPIKAFFKDLWGFVVETFDKALAAITKNAGKIARIGAALGGPSALIAGELSSALAGPSAPAPVSPGERVARNIEERKETSTAEVTIKDETGRAEMTSSGSPAGISLKLQGSGGL